MNPDDAYKAVKSRDTRFDGIFFTGVTSTGIYCRPSCPARTPSRRNVRFFSTTAAARHAGYRPCKRCLPDAAPGSPQWNMRADSAARAVVMIRDGVIDREGVPGLARRLGYSERHLRRLLHSELGVGPMALALSQRASTARSLLVNSDLPVGEVAFASGFSSLRQCNEIIRATFGTTPTALRGAARTQRHVESIHGTETGNELVLQLPVRLPYDLSGLLEFLGTRAVPGSEEFLDGTYRRVLRLPHSLGIVTVASTQRLESGRVAVRLQLDDVRDLGPAVARTIRVLDLDADPNAINAVLGTDPLLYPLVTDQPGRRVPGNPDAEELAIRAVLGQQVSVVAARRLAAHLVERHGTDLARPSGTLTRAFPTAKTLALLSAEELPMPRTRARALIGLAGALSQGDVDLSPGADREAATNSLLALAGIGPWTTSYVRMRALGDPDAFLASDLGVRRAFEARGLPSTAPFVTERARAWRPWRAYALMHLWQGDPDECREHAPDLRIPGER